MFEVCCHRCMLVLSPVSGSITDLLLPSMLLVQLLEDLLLEVLTIQIPDFFFVENLPWAQH